ncbi:pentraxin-4 isoform X2 [Sceloporus undulatus]|uniref:pentraxin-4 isoform X2 n=1 Tax=Sceloporus undulatus TaxID=8520 RepID=UPI001C4B1699|nr:pentraxin-4 isoform X2 [Sceloporus undulatus]
MNHLEAALTDPFWPKSEETLLQPAAEQRKPFFERFRRLEEQFRRFQEVTLLRLQEIAGNYNVSYNIDAKFDQLLSRQDALEAMANVSHAATEEELHQLKAWMKKLQSKAKKQDSVIATLEDALQGRSQEDEAKKEQEKALLANLTHEVATQKEEGQATWTKLESLQKVLEGLQDALKTQGSKMDELEQQMKTGLANNEVLLPGHLAAAHLLSQDHPKKGPEAAGGQQPTLKKLRAKHRQRKKLHQESIRLVAAQSQKQELKDGFLPGQKGSMQETPADPGVSSLPEAQALKQPSLAVEKGPQKQEAAGATRKPGTICNVGSMLVFPNASTENFAAFRPSFLTGLLELSLCSWVRTQARYLGTILSYATEENDNKLVLHGRDAAPRNAVHFVIGDPAFRELPVGRILDGKWHHLCVLWSSIQGRYWFYVDRRVVSMGSHFRKGYEIPPGGSLILGQEQDSLGGGFEPSESFVGFLAGLALWDRILAPGEVSGIAVGNGLPRGPLLTLANVSALHGSAEKVDCACLEHCL